MKTGVSRHGHYPQVAKVPSPSPTSAPAWVHIAGEGNCLGRHLPGSIAAAVIHASGIGPLMKGAVSTRRFETLRVREVVMVAGGG